MTGGPGQPFLQPRVKFSVMLHEPDLISATPLMPLVHVLFETVRQTLCRFELVL